jgi:hypothetical protein
VAFAITPMVKTWAHRYVSFRPSKLESRAMAIVTLFRQVNA